jgi:hypothetical protein
MVDFMPVDQGWPGRNIRASARPAYKYIPASFIYAGITEILVEECRHMLRYAGLAYLIYCAGAGRPDYPTFMGCWSGI